MRLPRIHLPRALAPGARLALDKAASGHVLRVLRLKPGAGLILFNGDGGEYEATLAAVENRAAMVTVGKFIAAGRESPLAITLAQGISRGERMDYTLQKSVELGVARIVPLQTEFSQVRLDGERLERRCQHWGGVLASAGEQCGRTRLPELMPVASLAGWLEASAAEGHGRRLVLDPAGTSTLMQLPAPETGGITLLIGPEGGLSGREIELARRAGYLGLRLGPRILRTETAGIAALAALQTIWGDLG
ncbi:MAG: 16S rRNA (uracil(1498)-N(3))-methyltransferase [Gammaproteobacteria bacterium]